jgi:hypothetical protein
MRLKKPAKLNIGLDLDRAAIEKARPPAESRNGATLGVAYPSFESANGAAPLFCNYTTPPQLPTSGPGMLEPGRNLEAGPHFSFQEGDGIAWLEHALSFLRTFGSWAGGYGQALIYCDPPYMRHTCATRCRYKFDLTDVDHRRLLRVLQDLNALKDPPMLMISGYDSELYREILTPPTGSPAHLENIATRHPWSHTTFQAMTRGGKQATEHLWFNFAPPQVLHDYRFMGTGFRDRERIKRRQQHWVNRLKKMPEAEKQALLNAIQETATVNAGQP